ncbi:hypothetical protein KP509_20G002600 [Ceratopteris richardii]|uniref:Uncharacterized protein n=1 Tax=Ceratopteris richardii TaxID=49495 RepID=A0A8T2SCH4_CERRI|nr:hypothetical protein KP509_20G002600 [Ceratopteris richardii]
MSTSRNCRKVQLWREGCMLKEGISPIMEFIRYRNQCSIFKRHAERVEGRQYERGSAEATTKLINIFD